MTVRAGVLAIGFCLLASACGPGGAAREWTEQERLLISRLAWTDEALRPDPTNRFADDPRAAALGQALFFDAELSASKTVSCASCHVPSLAFTDGRPVAEGLFTGRRNTQTLLGAAAQRWLFWDGRKDSVWSQALGPLENPTEHGLTRIEAVRTLATKYRAEYEAVFGHLPALDETLPARAMPMPTDPDSVEHRAWLEIPESTRAAIDEAFANLGKAIAAYERRLVPGRSPFDDYAEAVHTGADSAALTPEAIAGLRLFIGKANCVACHDGPLLSDGGFHNIGAPVRGDPDRGRSVGARAVLADPFNCRGPFSDASDDCGELGYLDPSFPDFEGAFRTPTLRNVARTAPYMHAGQFDTLAEVVAFYDTLPGLPAAGHREPTLVPLGLTAEESAQLVAFLESLTGAPLDDALTRSP